ncbi:MAG: c-type cytochrome [Cyclobacteriaceae bacterium]|nr:c-type cytochrome [Cyclobacteriaceae bacterium]
MKNPTTHFNQFYRYVLIFGFILTLGSCVYQEIEPIVIPKPPVPQQTQQLEATYSTQPLNSINSLFWSTSDYKLITVSDQLTATVNSQDGILNTSGTYNGLTDYNKGVDPQLTLKAAYDDQNLYILASWKDETLNPTLQSWLYNGLADPNKADDPAGWTRQRGDDQLQINFDMGGGKEDIWKWSFTLSEPLGYAMDMVNDGGVTNDAGTPTYINNELDGTNRSGPALEWDGVQQDLTRDPGGFTILDPGFYLVSTSAFSGDIANGELVYQAHCSKCHGVNGDGQGTNGSTSISFRYPGTYSRISRSSFPAIIDVGTHDGQSYWSALTPTEQNDLLSRIYGWAGIPGYTLQNPTGSSADVLAMSNIALARMLVAKKNPDGYSVLLIRKLDTGNADDVSFLPATDVNFNVFLYDNDEINKIGALNETLIFKPKQ